MDIHGSIWIINGQIWPIWPMNNCRDDFQTAFTLSGGLIQTKKCRGVFVGQTCSRLTYDISKTLVGNLLLYIWKKHICIWIWLLEKHISILDISRLTWFFTWFFSAARDLRFCAGNKPADSRSTMSWGMMTAVLVNYLELKSFECAQPLLVDDYGGLYYPNLPNIEWGLSCSFNTPCPPEIESSTQSR